MCSCIHVKTALTPKSCAVTIHEDPGSTPENITDQLRLYISTVFFLQDTKASAPTPDILHCDNPRPFWISWGSGYVEVGKGSVYGGDRILEWQDPEPMAVAYVSVTTGFEATGSWEFSAIPGRELELEVLSFDCGFLFREVYYSHTLLN